VDKTSRVATEIAKMMVEKAIAATMLLILIVEKTSRVATEIAKMMVEKAIAATMLLILIVEKARRVATEIAEMVEIAVVMTIVVEEERSVEMVETATMMME